VDAAKFRQKYEGAIIWFGNKRKVRIYTTASEKVAVNLTIVRFHFN
jgi:hypothetical protein